LIKILLLLVFVIALAVPVFNRTGPALLGFPFFYWYQILAVPVSSLIIFIVFRAEDREDEP
jgi:ABC-type multidrug transport system permease subunit